MQERYPAEFIGREFALTDGSRRPVTLIAYDGETDTVTVRDQGGMFCPPQDFELDGFEFQLDWSMVSRGFAS
jgi:hypothetical protein